MNCSIRERFFARISQREELDATIAYLTKHLKPIVKSSESTLICFPREKETDFGYLVGKAVLECGGFPVYWEKDLRWKELLRLAFRSKASTIIATPLILLGLTKIALYEKIPLHFYNAILAGYPCKDWMLEGIAKGLDCVHWGVFSPENTCIIGGFACSSSPGVHLRDDKFTAHIVDEQDNPLPDTSGGAVVLRLKEEPEAAWNTGLFGRFIPGVCPCGNPAPRLDGDGIAEFRDSPLINATQQMLLWSSVLDCVFRRTAYGLELEVVCFPGERLPQFPGCAKLLVRSWNPEQDCPMPLGDGWGMY